VGDSDRRAVVGLGDQGDAVPAVDVEQGLPDHRGQFRDGAVEAQISAVWREAVHEVVEQGGLVAAQGTDQRFHGDSSVVRPPDVGGDRDDARKAAFAHRSGKRTGPGNCANGERRKKRRVAPWSDGDETWRRSVPAFGVSRDHFR
jgi:hypothetical protein